MPGDAEALSRYVDTVFEKQHEDAEFDVWATWRYLRGSRPVRLSSRYDATPLRPQDANRHGVLHWMSPQMTL